MTQTQTDYILVQKGEKYIYDKSDYFHSAFPRMTSLIRGSIIGFPMVFFILIGCLDQMYKQLVIWAKESLWFDADKARGLMTS